jgi:RimJ/RimL family protein N-acetyltransferase
MKKLKINRIFIRNIINEKEKLSINIFDQCENIVGYLKPITKSVLGSKHIIEKLTIWRNKFMQYFLTQFIATNERTMNWLKNIVLKDNGKLLFIINDKNDNPVGHIGIKSLSENDVEIDNFIKGESLGHKQITYFAEIAMIKWIFETLKLESICGYAFSENIIALMLHKEVGFKIGELYGFNKKIEGKDIVYEKSLDKIDSCDRYVRRIVLKKEDFFRKNKLNI